MLTLNELLRRPRESKAKLWFAEAVDRGAMWHRPVVFEGLSGVRDKILIRTHNPFFRLLRGFQDVVVDSHLLFMIMNRRKNSFVSSVVEPNLLRSCQTLCDPCDMFMASTI